MLNDDIKLKNGLDVPFIIKKGASLPILASHNFIQVPSIIWFDDALIDRFFIVLIYSLNTFGIGIPVSGSFTIS